MCCDPIVYISTQNPLYVSYGTLGLDSKALVDSGYFSKAEVAARQTNASVDTSQENLDIVDDISGAADG
jgi:hypothetical protein